MLQATEAKKTPSVASQWLALFQAPRALAVIYAVKVLISYGHYSAGIILTLWLSKELGLSDAQAGAVYGFTGLFGTVVGVVCGALIDKMGVRRSLALGCALASLTRFFLVLCTTRPVALVLLWIFLPLADALGIPVLAIGVKRCSSRSSSDFSTLGFGVFYSLQNVACVIAALSIDILRRNVQTVAPILALFGSPITHYRAVFLVGGLVGAFATMVVLLGLEDLDAGLNRPTGSVSMVSAIRDVASQPRFKRFFQLSLMVLGISMVYRHLDATLPKYMIRVFGKDAPYGTYYSIEPGVVIFAVPIFSSLLTNVPIYTCLIFGTLLASLSPFWLCLGDRYWLVAAFVITLSLGESIYSPRLYEYSMSVAPPKSEGVYSALGNAPLFAVNLVAGGISGILLQSFVPETGVRRPGILWVIIGLLCLTSPLLLILFRNRVEETEVDQQAEQEPSRENIASEEDEEAMLSLTAAADRGY